MPNHVEIPEHPVPWQPRNKGLLVGRKRPLKPKDVWAIRVRLEINASKRIMEAADKGPERESSRPRCASPASQRHGD